MERKCLSLNNIVILTEFHWLGEKSEFLILKIKISQILFLKLISTKENAHLAAKKTPKKPPKPKNLKVTILK